MFNIFQKMITLIDDVFPKLKTRNVWNIQFYITLPQATWKTGTNTVPIWTTAPLPYFLIIANIIQLEKVSFSAMQNLKTVC